MSQPENVKQKKIIVQVKVALIKSRSETKQNKNKNKKNKKREEKSRTKKFSCNLRGIHECDISSRNRNFFCLSVSIKRVPQIKRVSYKSHSNDLEFFVIINNDFKSLTIATKSSV